MLDACMSFSAFQTAALGAPGNENILIHVGMLSAVFLMVVFATPGDESNQLPRRRPRGEGERGGNLQSMYVTIARGKRRNGHQKDEIRMAMRIFLSKCSQAQMQHKNTKSCMHAKV